MLYLLKGWLGEKITTFGMWLRLDAKIYHRLDNLIVPSPNGTTQIDHVLVSVFGIFVIETKNYRGWIFGSENSAQWSQVIFGHKYGFQNPLRQNFRHTKSLADYLGIDHGKLHSVVFFLGDCTFKTKMPSNVLNRGLITHIHGFRSPYFSSEQVSQIFRRLQDLKSNPVVTRREHLHSLHSRHTSGRVCPKCGSILVRKTARRGRNAGGGFLACPAYPECRFTKSLN